MFCGKCEVFVCLAVLVAMYACPVVPPFIVRHPVSREVEEGEDLRLVCTANGVPFPNITWFFNNTEVRGQGSLVLPGNKQVIRQEMTS